MSIWKLPHLHIWRYVKTGVDFTYSESDLAAMPARERAWKTFEGPIVHLYQCRCGKLRRVE